MTTAPAAAIAPGYAVAARRATYQMIFPIETTAYAFRLGVADPYQGSMSIQSASVYASDSYSGLDPSLTGFVPGRNITTLPTAHSVYQTCNTTAHSNVLACTNTSVLPRGAPIYVIGPFGLLPANDKATIHDAATLRLSIPAQMTGTYHLQFANLAPECKIYFDHAGADVGSVNTQGVHRSLVVQGNPQSPNNNPQPYTLQWSDFIPCNLSAPRVDGGKQPLVFVYLTLAVNSTFGANSGILENFDVSIAPDFGGRYVYQNEAWIPGADFSDNPSGSGFRLLPSRSPFQVFQYLTTQPGWNVVQSGDSIAEAPPEDHLATGIWRACKLLSTPQYPCEWASTAWGGQTSEVYNTALANNIAALQPSALVAQPISRNDFPRVTHSFLGSMQHLMAEAQGFVAGTDIRIGYYGAFPLSVTLDRDVADRQAVSTMMSTLAAQAQTCQNGTSGQNCTLVPLLNPVPFVSRAVLGGAFWDYLGIGLAAATAASPGTTTISITSRSEQGTCYANDVLTDTTTPSAIAPGTQVIAAMPTSLTLPSSAIVGPGVAAGDALVCAMPGWNGGALSFDNKHPWYPVWPLLQPAANAFMQQLLTQ